MSEDGQPDPADTIAPPDIPGSRLKPLTEKRRRLIQLVIQHPDWSNQQLADEMGLSCRDKVARLLKTPQVSNILHNFLDAHSAKLEDSARVIGEAHEAEKVKLFQHKGQVITSLSRPDHDVRLRGAELNLKVRGKLNDPGVTINLFDSLSDAQVAEVASGRKTINDFVDVSPGGGS